LRVLIREESGGALQALLQLEQLEELQEEHPEDIE
jgi:hypothetical protein